MILVVTGTHEQSFNRLLQAVEGLATDEDIFFQTGHCTYAPTRGTARAFVDADEMAVLMQQARAIICHAGTGTVMTALSHGKTPVVAARRRQFGEHVDDHQMELVKSLADCGLIVPFVPGEDSLQEKIEAALLARTTRRMEPATALVDYLHQAITTGQV